MSQVQPYMPPTAFEGELSLNSERIRVTFVLTIDSAGEAKIQLDRIPYDSTSVFLTTGNEEDGTSFTHFQLTGRASDGTTFECADVFFTSTNIHTSRNECTICPTAHYSVATISMITPEVIQGTCYRMRIKGFDALWALETSSPLGQVNMSGARNADGVNELAGEITVHEPRMVDSRSKWKTDVKDLCQHVRYMMSFARAVGLHSPVEEYFEGQSLTITLMSSQSQERSNWAPISTFEQQIFFKRIVEWYFDPPFPVQRLRYATQWFTMQGTYRETDLISTMTVLENLIDSNLSDTDVLLLTPKTYDKLRAKLSEVVKEAAKSWTPDEAERADLIDEFNRRFAELKRRSFIDKLNLLAKRWGVDLDDIPKTHIGAAKSARDQVVHRGYYESRKPNERDLHSHLLLVRELVVRFVLTALQFEGNYLTHLNGQQSRRFTRHSTALDFTLRTP